MRSITRLTKSSKLLMSGCAGLGPKPGQSRWIFFIVGPPQDKKRPLWGQRSVEGHFLSANASLLATGSQKAVLPEAPGRNKSVVFMQRSPAKNGLSPE